MGTGKMGGGNKFTSAGSVREPPIPDGGFAMDPTGGGRLQNLGQTGKPSTGKEGAVPEADVDGTSTKTTGWGK